MDLNVDKPSAPCGWSRDPRANSKPRRGRYRLGRPAIDIGANIGEVVDAAGQHAIEWRSAVEALPHQRKIVVVGNHDFLF